MESSLIRQLRTRQRIVDIVPTLVSASKTKEEVPKESSLFLLLGLFRVVPSQSQLLPQGFAEYGAKCQE